MDILKFRVRGQALTLTNPNVNLIPVTDTVNQYLCQFEFSEDWDDLNKVVVFKNVSYNITKEVYLSTSNECYIPWEVLSNSGEIFLEVIGTEVRGEVVTVRIPSTLLGFKWQIQEGLLDVSANISPTPDLFEQFVSSVRSDSIVAATARDEAVIARDVAVQSAADASASELAATSAAESAVNSASTASSAASSASESALSVAGVADETKSYAEIASAKAAEASTQAEIAAGAKEDAVTAKAGAEAARDEAATSADLAQTTESHIKTMTVSAHSLAETEAPTVTKTDTSTGFALDFGIPKGATGPKGEDGDNIHYTWVKYADTPTSGMSDNPTGKAYMGIAYNKSTPVGSTVYSDYAWSRIKGETGEDGYSPKVTTGTSSDGSTTVTVTNKDGSTTTTLVDGTARSDIATMLDKNRSGHIETLSGSGFVQSTETEDGGLAEVVVYGKSVQDGTPTSEAPVEIQSVENPKVTACGTNVFDAEAFYQHYYALKQDIYKVTVDGVECLKFRGDSGYESDKFHRFPLKLKPNTQYVISYRGKKDSVYGYASTGIAVGYSDGGYNSTFCADTTTFTETVLTSMANKTITNLYISYGGNEYCYLDINSICIREVGTEFEPYTGKTATLSDIVLMSIPDGTRDKLFKDTDGLWKVDRKCGVVDLGKLTWTYVSTGTRFNAELPQIKTVDSNTTKTNILCSSYVAGSPNDTWNIKDKVISANTDSHLILVRDTAYTDATTFKSAMSGVMAVYELATPTYEILPDSIQSELNALTTYNPITNVMVSDGVTPDIDVSFWTRDYYAKSVAENAQEDIDNFEIGGRNLLIGSEKGVVNTNADTSSWADLKLQVYNGKTYVGLEFRFGVTAGEHIEYTYTSQYSGDRVIVGDNGGVYDGVETFLVSEYKEGVVYTLSCDVIDDRPNVVGGYVLKNIKLEKGNKATDWTPAPEDKANTPVLLWTNASPKSSFTAQTVLNNPTGQLSVYDAIEVEFLAKADDVQIQRIRVKKGDCGNTVMQIKWDSGTNAYIGLRSVSCGSNGVVFGVGGYLSTISTFYQLNEYCIPQRIYGIKGV